MKRALLCLILAITAQLGWAAAPGYDSGDGAGGSGGGASLPVTDDTAIVKGAADDTKQAKLDVSNVTPGQTRKMFVPDLDTYVPAIQQKITIAGPTAARTYTFPDADKTMLATDGNGSSLTALNATQLTTGTVPDARFPATLPAVSGANLTSLPAGNLTGSVADARLSANVPLKDGANIFTGDSNTLSLVRGSAASAPTFSSGSVTSNVGTINTASAHGLVSGDWITISAATGVANGVYEIRKTSATQFTVKTSSGNGTITAATIAVGKTTSFGANSEWYANQNSASAPPTVSITAQGSAPALRLGADASYGGTILEIVRTNNSSSAALIVSGDGTVSGTAGLTGWSTIIGAAVGGTGSVNTATGTTVANSGKLGFYQNGGNPANGTQTWFACPTAGIFSVGSSTLGGTPDAWRFDYSGRIYGNAVTAPTFSSGSVTTNVVTINTTAAHNLANGQTVTVSGTTGVSCDATRTITVVDSDTFTYPFTVGNGTVTAATINPRPNLRLGAQPTTPDGLADVQISSTAATQKPLVVQGAGSQTANLTEWQDSTGAIVAKVGPDGSLTQTNMAAICTADLSKTNNTFETITGMSVPVRAGKMYRLKAVVHSQKTTTGAGGAKVQLGGTATLTGAMVLVKDLTTNQRTVLDDAADPQAQTNVITYQMTALNSPVGNTLTGPTWIFEFDGVIEINAGGTITIEGAQNTTNGDATIFKKYSPLTLTPMN